MGDYLEEILDSNDLELELMAALDESDLHADLEDKELFFEDEVLDELGEADYNE